jgi:alpha-D-xyloside xylohydrolase
MQSSIDQRLGKRAAAAALVVAGLTGCLTTPAVERTEDGLVVRPREGPAARVRLQVMNERIIRVTAIPTGTFDLPRSLQVVAGSGGAEFRVSQAGDVLTLSTARVRAAVSMQTGLVTFSHAAGEAVLTEVARDEFRPVEIDGERFYAIRQRFNRGGD